MRRFHYVLAAALVAALVLSPTFKANAEPPHKQPQRDELTAASLIAAATAPIPIWGPFTAGFGLGFQAGGLLALARQDKVAAAATNPDPNHGALVSVTPTNVTPVAGTGAVADAVNGSLITLARIADDSLALDTAVRRCFGAQLDGNTADVALQRDSAAGFFADLRQAVTNFSSDLTAVATSIQSTPVATVTISISDVLALRDEIVASGFPPEEMALFSQMNATPDEIQAARDEVAAATGATLSGVDLSVAGLLTHAGVVNGTYIADILQPILGSLPPPCGSLAVGGTFELLAATSDSSGRPAHGSGPSVPYAPIAGGLAAAAAAVAAGSWYARRRWMR